MKAVLGFCSILVMANPSLAGSWYEKKINGKLLYDLYKEAGVPSPALENTFEFLDLNELKEFEVKLKDETTIKRISNNNYAVIIDYSKPSSKRRLYLLDLKKGSTSKYYVAHGLNTGNDNAHRFSNQIDSKKSSLGFFITGSIYYGSHGESLYLHGLEPSNDRAFQRDIVMHGAPYVSLEFLNKHGRMGRSWGCPAVAPMINKKILPLIKNGAVLYAYHKDLMTMAQTSPTVQNVSNNKEEASENGDEVVSEELNP